MAKNFSKGVASLLEPTLNGSKADHVHDGQDENVDKKEFVPATMKIEKSKLKKLRILSAMTDSDQSTILDMALDAYFSSYEKSNGKIPLEAVRE